MRASESLWVGIRSLVKIPGKATYSKHDSTLFLSFFEFRFLFIAPDALDVISSIRVVGFVVGDVELAHDGKRLRCVVCLSLRPGAFSLDNQETRYFNQQETPACDVMRHERIQSVKLTSVILRIPVLEEDSRVSLIPVAYHGVEDEFTIAHPTGLCIRQYDANFLRCSEHTFHKRHPCERFRKQNIPDVLLEGKVGLTLGQNLDCVEVLRSGSHTPC